MNRFAVLHATTVHKKNDTRIFYKEAKALAENNYNVKLMVQSKNDEVVDGVNIISLPEPKNRFERIVKLTWMVFQKARHQNADVYHFHDPELIPVGLLLKIFTKAKVIYDVHEDVPEQIMTKYWIPKFIRKPFAILFNIFEKYSSQKFDGIITATESIARKFKHKNIVVVHNFPRLEMLPVISKRSADKNEKIIIYVGGISKLRGAIEMVKAMEYIDSSLNVRLKIIGTYENHSIEEEFKKIKGYDKVIFHDYLPPNQVYEHYRDCFIGLVCLHPEPRYTVSMPVKLFEYMAAGLPVIASNFPLWKEIVEGNKCGITVNPLDPVEIASAIKYLLSHPEEAQKMGQNGRKAVEEKYNWKLEEKKLLKLYYKLFNTYDK